MIETDHSFVIDAPIGAVWAYASDIGNWASSMPGYESFEEVDELRSNWVLKIALGALTRRVPLSVAIIDRREPDHISFELRGGSDPVEGRGTFIAVAQGPQQTSVVVSLAIWGSGPMAGTMEAMSRPVVPRMTRVVSESFKNAVEQKNTPASAAQPLPGTRRLASAAPAVSRTRRWESWSRWRARLLRGTRRWARGAHRTDRGSSQSRSPQSRQKLDRAMAEQLDPRLQVLLDKEEIREVTYRFARGVDRHDWELIRSCYHDDAVDCHGVFDGPASEYVEWAAENVPKLATATTHHVSNGLIDVEGDVAFCETYVLASHRYVRNDGQSADFLCGARYVDRFERRDGQWLIAHRQLLWDWVRDDRVEGEFDAVGIDPSMLRFGEQGPADGVYTIRADAA